MEDEKLKNINIAYLTILTFSKDQKQKLKKFKKLDHIQKSFDNKELITSVNRITKK